MEKSRAVIEGSAGSVSGTKTYDFMHGLLAAADLRDGEVEWCAGETSSVWRHGEFGVRRALVCE